MATEKQLIDANEAYEIARSSGLHDDFCRCMADLTSLKELLEDCTTVDAVEVVRCKDCRWWNEHSINEKILLGYCVKTIRKVTRCDDFCSYGERRTNT